MVNELKRVAAAFVGSYELRTPNYWVTVDESGPYVRSVVSDSGYDVFLFNTPKITIGLFIDAACRHRDLRDAFVQYISQFIGPPPEWDGTNAYIVWGGPLTWLALKAVLTTGGNDAP